MKLLCQACPELIGHRATGTFFAPGKRCYYGELPLSFAVSVGRPEIVEYLLQQGANPAEVDSQGNNALHMAIIHGIPEMYDLLMAQWKAHGDEVALWSQCLSCGGRQTQAIAS